MKYCTDDGKHIFDTKDEYDDFVLSEEKKRLEDEERKEAEKKLVGEIEKKCGELAELIEKMIAGILDEKPSVFKPQGIKKKKIVLDNLAIIEACLRGLL